MQWPFINRLNVPLAIFTVTVTLLCVGLVEVYSASATLSGYEQRVSERRQGLETDASSYHGATYLKKQLIWGAIGLIALALFVVGGRRSEADTETEPEPDTETETR